MTAPVQGPSVGGKRNKSRKVNQAMLRAEVKRVTDSRGYALSAEHFDSLNGFYQIQNNYNFLVFL